MTKIAFTFAAAITFSGALALPAAADGRDDVERNAWRQTAVEAHTNPAANALVEGRNVATPAFSTAPQGIEPYIARQMERDRRGRGR
jgi:hypothetical protein